MLSHLPFLLAIRDSFVRDYLGAPAGVDVDEIKSQNEAFKKQIEQKDAEIAELKKQVRIWVFCGRCFDSSVWLRVDPLCMLAFHGLFRYRL